MEMILGLAILSIFAVIKDCNAWSQYYAQKEIEKQKKDRTIVRKEVKNIEYHSHTVVDTVTYYSDGSIEVDTKAIPKKK